VLSLYLKIAVRHFRNQNFYGLINLLGLAFSIACSLILFLYLLDDLSYDRHFPNYKRIYRLTTHLNFGENEINVPMTPSPVASELELNYSGIENFCRIILPGKVILKSKLKQAYNQKVYEADSSFFNIFPYPFLSGNSGTALNQVNSIVISRKLAVEYFGSINVLGKTIETDDEVKLVVTGVLKEFTNNSHFDFEAIVSRETLPEYDYSPWTSFNNYTYLVLGQDYQAGNISKDLEELYQRNLEPIIKPLNGSGRFGIQPLSDIHLKSNLENELSENASLTFDLILTGVAVFMLVMGSINYASLATAKYFRRKKEIGIKKLFGTTSDQLKGQFLVEAFFYTTSALILSLVIADIVLPSFSELSGKDLTLRQSSISFFILLSGIIVVVGYSAGIYPAHLLSRLKILSIFKRSQGKTSAKSISLRKSMIVLQLSITFIMLIGGKLMKEQIDYLDKINIGIEEEDIFYVDLQQIPQSSRTTFAQIMKEIPKVSSISFSNLIPNDEGQKINVFTSEVDGKISEILAKYNIADERIAHTLSLEFISGSIPNSPGENSPMAIVNEHFADVAGYTDVGATSYILHDLPNQGSKAIVVGIIKDIYFTPLTRKVLPLVILIGDQKDYLWIKANPGSSLTVMDKIKLQWESSINYLPIEFGTYSNLKASFYIKESRLIKIISLFSYFMIVIFGLGLFSLSAYLKEMKMSEIGLRRVIGASRGGIILLFNRQFVLPLVFSILISWPVAFLMVNNWISEFWLTTQFDIGIFIWISILGIIATFIITGFHTYQVLQVRPTEVLGYE